MKRYDKQIKLKQVGQDGQKKLADAKVLIVGAGGLGAAILPYLASAGIGKIGLIDGDCVDETNLHRQIIYTEKSVGQFKVEEAAKYIQKLNSQIKVEAIKAYLTAQNAFRIINKYDLVVDATDNINARYLINDICVMMHKAFVYGAVHKFEGQISVFNYKNGPTYRCLFPENKQAASSCEELGILGPNVGIIGTLQANEVLKIILETGQILSGKLLLYNFLNNQQTLIHFKKNEHANINCHFHQQDYATANKGISAEKAIKENFILIDIREKQPQEHGSHLLHIPFSQLNQAVSRLDENKNYALFCQKGIISQQAVQQLSNYNLNLYYITDNADRILNLWQHEKEKSIY